MTPRRAVGFLGGAALAIALPFLLAQTGPAGGLPSRPRFAGLTLHGSEPAFEIRDTAADADEERWQLKAHSGGAFGCFAFNVENDAGTVIGGPMIEACRDGTAQMTVTLAADAGEVDVEHASTAGPVGAVQRGTYTGAVTGCTTDPAPVIQYTRIGGRADAPADAAGIVALKVPTFSCTSNLTSFSIAGAPALLQPTGANAGQVAVYEAQNNSVTAQGGAFAAVMNTAGTMSFYRNGSLTGWTNSGTKGVTGFVFVYPLDDG